MLGLRSLSGALALVVCLCVAALAGTANAQTTPAHHKAHRANRRRTHHAVRCAKKSSFHTSGGHIRRKHHHTSCTKRGKQNSTGVKHGGSQHRRSHHFKAGKRTGRHPKRHVSSTVKPADAGSCTNANLQPTQEDIEVIRTATLCLINQERADHGEAALAPNADLQQAAQAHTESMAFDDYFEHDGPQGDTPLSRITSCGYIYSSQVGYEVGENIGWGTFELGTPRAIVAAWMASPGHRANILDVRFRDTAIGVSPHVPTSLSQGQPGGIYTQDFGVIITG